MTPRSVSVIVNTYNRAESLAVTLDALGYLDYPNFEVVVVKGPCTDDTDAVLARYDGAIKVGTCSNANLSESRNIGVALAAGEIVAFIDDDAYPDPAWLDGLAAAFDDDEVAGAGGPVYDHTGAALQCRYIVSDRFGDSALDHAVNPSAYFNQPFSNKYVLTIGTNSSFRRERLVEIGGFDEEFEYFLEENDVCCRLVDRGYVIRALDDAFVYHKFLPSGIRQPNRAIRDRYQVLKSKCYFALKHGLKYGSFYDVCVNLVEFVRGNRDDYEWCVREGLLTADDLAQFERDVRRASGVGLARFRSGDRRTREPSWFLDQTQPLLPYPIRRPAESKLHVCLLSQGYAPGPINGIARVIYTLARGLAERGHIVRVLTRGEGYDRVDFEDGVWVHRVAIKAAPVVESDVPQAIVDYSSSMLRELHRVAATRCVDLVEVPNWDSEGIAILEDGTFRTVLGLYTTLAVVRQIDPAAVSGNPDLDRVMAAERRCYELAEAFRAPDLGILESVEREYGVSLGRDRVALIPHGLPDVTEGVKPRRREGVNVLFVGRLERRKGIDTLLSCIPSLIRRFPELVFTVVGDDSLVAEEGRGTYRKMFEASCSLESGSPRVVFTGVVDDLVRAEFYAGCDIFVAPSRSESFGLICIEAMMFGKPVVAGDNLGMRKIVEHGANGYLVTPGDTKALEEAIGVLVAEPHRRAQFGARSRELFLERFSSTGMVDRSEAAYRALMER